MAVNIPGDEAFSVGGETIMEILDNLTAALEDTSSDPVTIRDTISAFLTQLDNAIDQISNVRANVGAKIKRLEDQQSSLDDRNLSYNTLLSNAQDTDIADTVSEIAKIQVALESLRASGSKVISQSLLDYLR